MRPNEFGKTVVIPARVVKGELQYFYGGALPKLLDGTILDLIIPEYAIADKAFLKVVQANRYQQFLPEGAILYSAVSSDRIPPKLRDRAVAPDAFKNYPQAFYGKFQAKWFVRLELREALQLGLRGTKLGRLKPVKCVIPAINQEAGSLNHAYRLISEVFEPRRISHAGNVFREMFHIDEAGMFWTLEDLRCRVEASNEGSLHRPVEPATR